MFSENVLNAIFSENVFKILYSSDIDSDNFFLNSVTWDNDIFNKLV